jgi:hypothetical protein
LSEIQWRVNGKYNLATSLNVKESKVALLYDPRLFQFFIIYELHFALPEDQLITLLQGSILNQQKTDLYNTLRQMIVKQGVESSLNHLGQSVHHSMTKLVTDIIYKIIPNKGTEQVAKIGKNTGNITFFFNADSQNVMLKAVLITGNAGAEAI